MATLNDRVFDNGLSTLSSEAGRLVICSQEPTTFAEADSTYKLGQKATPTVAAPADRTGGGRQCTVSSFSDGSVSATGTATHFALVDTANSRLLTTQALSSSQGVTNGNTFSLTSFQVGFQDPA